MLGDVTFVDPTAILFKARSDTQLCQSWLEFVVRLKAAVATIDWARNYLEMDMKQERKREEERLRRLREQKRRCLERWSRKKVTQSRVWQGWDGMDGHERKEEEWRSRWMERTDQKGDGWSGKVDLTNGADHFARHADIRHSFFCSGLT